MIRVCDFRYKNLFFRRFSEAEEPQSYSHWFGDFHYATGLAYFLQSSLPTFLGSVIYAASSIIRYPIATTYNLDLFEELNTINEAAPIMIFSHGLGGSRFMSITYSHFAEKMVHKGYTVFALEHQDGTACSTESNDGKIINYKFPPEETIHQKSFRRQQLIERSCEIIHLCQELYNKYPNRPIILCGHSFGGASIFNSLQRKDSPPIHSVLLIDPWWFATIPEDYTNTKEHQPNLKIFTAYTETFHWPEQDEQALSVKETIGENFHVLDCPNTKHQDLSDLNVHLPWIMTFMGLAGSEGGEKHVDQVINWFIENTNS